MPWKVLGAIDPATGQLKTQQPVVSQQKPVQQQQPTEANAGVNLEALAALSAQKQMQQALIHGGAPTQEHYEAARKQAYSDLMQFQRNVAAEKIRGQQELQRQETLQMFQENMPKRPTDTMLEKQTGLSTSIDTIMNLHALHADARKVPGYSTAGVSAITTPLAQITDPRVRLYEAEKNGAIINLGRGVLEDTGQVAGKSEAQDLMKALMPGQGDDERMSGQKTVGMLQKVMIGLDARIRDYKKSNYQTDALQEDYKKAYANYLPLITQFGSEAQQSHPVASPDELFGGGEVQKQYEKSYLAKAITPPTQVGVSNTTAGQLNLGASSVQPLTGVPPSGPLWTPGQGEQPTVATPDVSPSGPLWTGADQTRATKEEQASRSAQALPSAVGSAVGGAFQSMIGQPAQSVQQTGQGIAGAINWLGSILPENRFPGGDIPAAQY